MIPEGRATGKTIRAVLKAARRMSKGERLVIMGENPSEAEHFMDRLRDVCGQLGFLITPCSKHYIRTVGGGSIRWCPEIRNTSGLRFDRRVVRL